MDAWLAGLDLSSFSGVVSYGRLGAPPEVRASGLADRRWSIPNEPSTIFGLASGTKGVTAVTVMALVEAGELELSTPVRSILGTDLPLIDDRVTVEHLLSHRSGIGDYLDEEAIGSVADHIMPVPVHELDGTAAYLPILDGHPQQHDPGEVFRYNNSGFVVLALIVERATGGRFERAVQELVLEPARLHDTAFHRMDTLPESVATGYLSGDPTDLRTNALHLPVVGSGDGGLFSTATDVHRFWDALLDGRLVSPAGVARITEPSADRANDGYGLGFWLTDRATIRLEGYDAGVSFVSEVDVVGSAEPTAASVWTVVSNDSEGAWPVANELTATA